MPAFAFEAIEHPRAFEWIEFFVKKTGFTGQIAFDFIESGKAGEIFPLECNPRATSGVHLFEREDRLDLTLLGLGDGCSIPRAGRMGMLGLAMLIYGPLSIRSLFQFKSWVRVVVHAKEVIFRLSDPAPFFYQFICLFYLWKKSLADDTSLLESSTHDIEWNGGA